MVAQLLSWGSLDPRVLTLGYHLSYWLISAALYLVNFLLYSTFNPIHRTVLSVIY